jgi:hypothetical protein
MAKLDPRADPVSEPPTKDDDFSVDRVAVPKPADVADIARDSEAIVASSVVAVSDTQARKKAAAITSQDPRYEPLEKLLDANDWKKICEELGPMDAVGKLPPNLGLVAALACNETSKDGDPEAIVTAVRCMAGLLGVAEDSPIARVLARRMLRKNPVRFTERKAPPARTSLFIVLVTLIVGGGVGFVVSAGSWRAALHMLHLR